jgi:hypothetical protein
MKKMLLSAVILTAFTALAQTPQPAPAEHRPATYRPPYEPPLTEEDKRFQSCESTGDSGFYWLDTRSGDLWRLDTATTTWKFLGSPRGANDGLKGTYQLLSDRSGGVYVLNTNTGEGWWTDGETWKTIGEPSRRMKKAE